MDLVTKIVTPEQLEALRARMPSRTEAEAYAQKDAAAEMDDREYWWAAILTQGKWAASFEVPPATIPVAVQNPCVTVSKEYNDRPCPACGSRRVKRKNRSTGNEFWGCSTFPSCRTSENINGSAHSQTSRFGHSRSSPVSYEENLEEDYDRYMAECGDR